MATWVTSEELAQDVEGQTLATMFLATVEQHPDQVALRWRNDDGSWGEWTYGDYADRVARAVTGLRELGVSHGDRVVLIFRNVPEFHILDVATMFCGATPVSLYNSSSPEQISYLAGHCQAKGAFVENIDFLERFLKVRDELPRMEWLGVKDDPGGLAGPDVITLDALLDHEPADLTTAAALVDPHSLATIIYTSGTTGPPKGVMINHLNAAFTAESLMRAVGKPPEELVGYRLVSYLPMAHIAERMTSHYAGIYRGYEVTLLPRPDPAGRVPSRDPPQPDVRRAPGLGEAVRRRAGRPGRRPGEEAEVRRGHRGGQADRPGPFVGRGDRRAEPDVGLPAGRRLWARARPDRTRPVRVRHHRRGAHPVDAHRLVQRPRSTAVRDLRPVGDHRPDDVDVSLDQAGSVGPAIPGCEVSLADDGEIICRGGNIFEGYLDDPAKTAEAIDAEGWFHSGDIGKVDEDGYFTIVDRKKELIITAGGKNISPANLEAALKTIPIVAQACAIGDNKPYVAALVVLDPEVAPAWARQNQIEFESIEDLAAHPAVREEVDRGLQPAMAPFSRAEQVKKFTILPGEWMPDSEELTPTMKLKRRGVHTKYAAEIDALYT